MSIFRMNQKSVALGVFYGVLTAMLWGMWPVLTRYGVQQTLSFYDLAALRFTISGLIFLPLVLRRGVGDIGWPRAMLLAGGAGVFYMMTAAQGLALAPAGHAGTIMPSSMMTFSMLGSWLFLGDKPGRARLIGYCGIILGIVLIGHEGLSGGIGPNVWVGDLLFVAGGFSWAIYTVTARSCGADPLHATALVCVLSMIFYMPVYLLTGPLVFAAPIAELLLQGVFQGVISAILALLFFTRAVSILGAARGALFAALVPSVVMILAIPVLGETPSITGLSGLGVVSIGMYYALDLAQLRKADGPSQSETRRVLSE